MTMSVAVRIILTLIKGYILQAMAAGATKRATIGSQVGLMT
jgi:hypothetical protein